MTAPETSQAPRVGPAPESPGTAALRELLATPAVKAWLKAGPTGSAAARTPALVRTLLWQDVDVSLSALSALPDLANALLAAVATLGEELERFPEPVLQAFVTTRLEAVDITTARHAAAVWLRLGRRLLGAGEAPLAGLVGARLLAPGLKAWNRWLETEPAGLDRHVEALLGALPPAALREAADRTATQLGAVMRRHPALADALARLVAGLAWQAAKQSLRSVRGRLGV